MSWIVSAVTIVSMQLLARKRIEGFYLGLFNQILWAVLIIQTEQWGLFALGAALTVTYIQGIQRWSKDTRRRAA